jgi:hypothetical protein
MISEALMRDRQRRLHQDAAFAWQVSQVRAARRTPLRMGAGRLLVRAGLRVAHVDPSSVTLGRLATN